MKATIKQHVLRTAIDKVAGAASNGKGTLEILANVKLQAEGEALTLTATNLSTFLTTTVPAIVDEPGETTVPVGVFQETIVRIGRGAEVELMCPDDVDILQITAGDTYSQLHGQPVGEFPMIPALEDDDVRVEFAVDREWFLYRYNRIAPVVAPDQSRPVLACVHFAFDGDYTLMEATDGFRAVRNETTYPEELTEERVEGLLQPATFDPVIDAMQAAQVRFRFGGGRNATALDPRADQLHVIDGDGSTTGVIWLLEGTFPDLSSVMPKKHDFGIAAPLHEVKAALKFGEIIANGGSKEVSMKVYRNDDEWSARIDANDSEVGHNNDRFEIEPLFGQDEIESRGNEQSAYSMNLNCGLLMGMIKPLEAERLTFSYNKPVEPVQLAVDGSDEYVGLLMPMQYGR